MNKAFKIIGIIALGFLAIIGSCAIIGMLLPDVDSNGEVYIGPSAELVYSPASDCESDMALDWLSDSMDRVEQSSKIMGIIELGNVTVNTVKESENIWIDQMEQATPECFKELELLIGEMFWNAYHATDSYYLGDYTVSLNYLNASIDSNEAYMEIWYDICGDNDWEC